MSACVRLRVRASLCFHASHALSIITKRRTMIPFTVKENVIWTLEYLLAFAAFPGTTKAHCENHKHGRVREIIIWRSIVSIIVPRCVRVRVRLYVCALFVCASVYADVFVSVCLCTRVSVYAFMFVRPCVCIRVCVRLYLYLCVHLCDRRVCTLSVRDILLWIFEWRRMTLSGRREEKNIAYYLTCLSSTKNGILKWWTVSYWNSFCVFPTQALRPREGALFVN